MDQAARNRAAREQLRLYCKTEADLQALVLDYLHEQQPHIPEHGSLQDKFSRLIERAGAEAVLQALTQAKGADVGSVPSMDEALRFGRPTGVFVGRRRELDWLKARLCGPETDLRPVAVCALQGMAGVGKSYLGDQLYEENRAAFPGGYVVLSVSPESRVTANGLLVELVARLRLNVPTDVQEQAVVARLRQPRTLLHIENVDDEALAAAVVELTQRISGCAVLVSARQQDVGLSPSLRWERVALSPLPHAEALEQLEREFRPPRTEREAEQYRQIVSELGALPLAVHLVAGRLTQGQRLDSLLADLRRLVLDRKAADPGEHSRSLLRASILSSVRALEQALAADAAPELPQERVNPALSGFAMGPSAGVGHSLANALLSLGESPGEAFLVRARGFSLVERIEEAGFVRWRMHPLIAATVSGFCAPLSSGGLNGMGAWFLDRLPQRRGAEVEEQAAHWQAIQAEEPALLHWLENCPAAIAAHVARIGRDYACVCGPYTAWGALGQRGLATADAQADRIALLSLWSETLRRSGRLDEAIDRAQAASVAAKAVGLEADYASALGTVADILQARGQLDEALRIRREESLPVFQKLGDIRSRAVTMGKIADILAARGQLDEALRIRREEELPVYQKLGDIRERAVTMGKIADILQARGQLDEALRILRQESLPVYQKLGDIRERAVTMGKIADILQARGQLDEALRIRREEELPVYQKLGDIRERAVTMGKIADILQDRGQLDEALRIRREESLPVYQKLGAIREQAVTMGQIADILQARGQLDEALRILRQESLPVYQKLGDIRSRAVTMGKIADILQARGQLDEALRIRREESLPVYQKLGARRDILICEWWIATYLQKRNRTGDLVEARRLAHKAYQAAVEMKLPDSKPLAELVRDLDAATPSNVGSQSPTK